MNTILAITAHPDDESFLFGGVLAQHARRGGRAALLCLTDGQTGRTCGVCAPEELGVVRRKEVARAAAVLGIELHLEHLMDGALHELSDEEGAVILRGYIDEVGADVLLTFGPEGASGHTDHRCCYRWTLKAAANGQRVYVSSFPEGTELPHGNPDDFLPATTVVDISELGDLKRRAFLEHKTQVDHLGIFDEIMERLGGKEYYHRVVPAWSGGELETSVVG